MDIRAAASQIKSIWIKEKSGFPLFLRFIPAGRSCVLNFPQQREREILCDGRGLFARPHVLKVRQKRRKLAVSGAENADFPIHRCSPPVRFSPIIPEAAGAVNRVSGKKISPPAKRPSTRLSRSSVDERRRARGVPGRHIRCRPSNRSAIPVHRDEANMRCSV